MKMKLKLMVAVVAMITVTPSLASSESDIRETGSMYTVYTDMLNASEKCPGVRVNMAVWDRELAKALGRSGPALIKSFNLTDAAEVFRGKRDDEFTADPAKNCAQAMKDYGPNGETMKGLLVKKN